MIFRWLKIMFYKIVKALSGSWLVWGRIHAVPGTDEGASRARHEAEISGGIHAVADRRNTARMRELIDKGLVHEPDGLGDLRRAELSEADLHEDALDAFDEIMSTRMKLMDEGPSKEIVCCGACGHPDHSTQGGVCAFLVPARGKDEEQLVCRCGEDS
jgi:hypothetical protein